MIKIAILSLEKDVFSLTICRIKYDQEVVLKAFRES